MAATPPPAAKQAAPFIKHIVLYGLGNATHPLTRHSVGQMAVTSLAKKLSLGSFAKDQKLSGELAEGRAPTPDYVRAAADGPESVTVTLVKSNYLMNISGRTLKPLLARYPLGPSTAHFILYDHLDFPDDKVQIRKGGSASGQNGMRSCLDVLGRKNAGEVFQVRIGIDRPTNSGMDVADYVLSRAPLDFINRYAQTGTGTEAVWNQILATAYPPPKPAGGKRQTKEENEAAMRAAKERREAVRREREKRAARKAAEAGLLTPPASDGSETP